MKDYKPILDKIKQLASEHCNSIRECFFDLVALMASSIDAMNINNREKSEKLYNSVIAKYSNEEREKFVDIFGDILLYFNKHSYCDLLGQLAQDLNVLDSSKSQFFTPVHISDFMSDLLFTKEDYEMKVGDHGYFSIADPCVGSGRLVISAAKQLEGFDRDFRKHIIVTACDIDMSMVYISFIQFSILGIPARIYCGNSLDPDDTQNYLETSPHLADVLNHIYQ